MLFFTEGRKYKNIKIVDSTGKDICKFENNELETENKNIISILKNKNKYPWINWVEETKIKATKNEK